MIAFLRKQLERLLTDTSQILTCQPYGSGELVVSVRALFSLEGDERERWTRNGNAIAGAEVTLGGVRAVTDANGLATIDLATLCDGEHALVVTPVDEAERTSVRAGPALGAGVAQDDMPFWMFRPITGTVVLADRKVVLDESAFAPGTDNARFYKGTFQGISQGADLVVDWRPDFLRANAGRNHERDGTVRWVILHRTGNATTDIGPTLNTFINPSEDSDSTASAHYVVDRDGFVVKMIQETAVSYHAGYSYWAGTSDLNPVTVGIEVVAAAIGEDVDNSVDEQYTQAQLDAIVRLFRELRSRFMLSRHALLGHSDINVRDPGDYRVGGDRIDCPGKTVDWAYLARQGAGTSAAIASADAEAIDQRIAEKYHGFFDAEGARLLYTDYDDPTTPFYGSRAREDLAGTNLLRNLQRDMLTVGYSCSMVFDAGREGDGWVGHQPLQGRYRAVEGSSTGLEQAVDCFQRHFMQRAGPTVSYYFTRDVARALEAVLLDLGRA